jgi:hypothetical protein
MHTARLLLIVLRFPAVALLASCATMTSGTSQRIPVTSVPPGASVTVEPGGARVTTPGTLVLPRKGPAYRVNFALEGYYPYQARILSTKENIPSGFALKFTWPWAFIDGATGADRTLFPRELHVDLLKKDGGQADSSGRHSRGP